MSEIVLHVGAHKAGSSSIQATLCNSRPELLSEGIGLYQGCNHTDFYRGFTDCPESFHQYYRGWRRKARQEETRNKIFQFYRNDRHEVELVSAEDVSLLSVSALKTLRSFLIDECGFTRVSVICYLREPLSYLNSSIQQFIKPGLTSLDDILNDGFENYRLQGCPDFAGGAQNILKQIYFPIPEKLINAFSPSDVTFIKFEEAIRKGLTREFLRYAVGERPFSWLEERRSNESMSHEACLLNAEYNDRHPLLLAGNKLNKRRNREKRYVPFVKALPGRKAQLVNVSKLDIAALNNEIGRVNESVGMDVFALILSEPDGYAGNDILEFSADSLVVLKDYVGGAMPDGNMSIDKLRRLNRLVEKIRNSETGILQRVYKKILQILIP